MNDDPLLASLAKLPRLEAPKHTARRAHRRALARFGGRSPNLLFFTLVHAAIALACLAYLVDLVLAAGALYR